MGSVNQGGQNIGWKYSTPLKADYLNTFIAGMTTPGLVTRPGMEPVSQGNTATVTIHPFSMFVIPIDKMKSGSGESDVLVKVTTTNDVVLNIDSNVVAIGFDFTFAKEGQPQSQWYGSFEPLTMGQLAAEPYKGLIDATVLNYTSGGSTKYFLSSQGADISDCLLLEEGWNPCCWLSLVSPRRMMTGGAGGTGYLNQLEVRCHNDAYDGYICGHDGFKELANLRYTVPSNPETDPNGIRGIDLPGKYNLFKITSEGFSLCNYGNSLPIKPADGGVFAMMDAKSNKEGDLALAFVNNVKLHPVSKEDVNLWYDSTEETLYIR